MRILFSTLFFLLLFASCGSDAEPVEAEVEALLPGRWELEAARRDNVKTTLLDGLYFDFGQDGSFRTNLLTNADQRGRYQRDGEEIITEGVEVALTYRIEALTEEALVLRASYSGYLFDFGFRRVTEEAD